MKKLTTKMLSVFICIAFTGLQMSFADVLQTGMFADRDVLTGAHIKGHTAGLTQLETDAALNNATLHFNNHTRIDWDKLNVYKNQSLYFKNGNFGVLNNVVGTSISKFAGLIKADSGKIIISNPNGILFQGGKFESLGGLVLTTKDLTALQIDETTDFDNLNINSAEYGDTVAVVVVSDSSNIAAADINIISQGIMVDSSTLSSSNANGIVLSTTDGANFVASHQMVADDGTTKNVSFVGKYSLTVANSAIKTPDGALTLTSDLGAYIDKADIEGDLIAETSGVFALKNGGNITGDVNLVSHLSTIHFNDVGNATLNVGGDLDMDAYYDNFVFSSIINGSSNIEGASVKISTSKFLGDTNIIDNAKDGYGVQLISSNFDDLTVNSADFVSVLNSVSGTTSLTSTSTAEEYSYIRVQGSTLGNTDITTKNGYIRIYNTGVNGNLTMKGYSLNMGYYETNGKLVAGSLNVSGDLVADIVNTIGYSDTVTAKTISLTTKDSSILAANSDNVSGLLVADKIVLNADKGEIVGLNANVINNTSDYFECMKNGDITTEFVSQFDKGQVGLAGGSAEINTYGAFKGNVDLTGDLTINTVVDRTDISGNVGNNVDINSQYTFISDLDVGNNLDVDSAYIGIYDSNVNGNASLIDAVKDKEGYGISVNNTTIGGTVLADSVNYINFRYVSSDDATLESKGSVRLTGVNLGDTSINTNSSVRIAGDSTFDGDLGIKSESLVLGYYETDATLVPGSINVAGTLNADVNGTIGYSSVVTADTINLTSKTCSIVEAESDLVNGKLVSDNINLSAHNGVIVKLDGNAANGTSDYYKAVTGPFTGENMVEKIGKTVDECGPISVASKTVNGDLNLTIDTSVINVKSDAGNTKLNVATDNLENLKLSSTGDINVSDITVKKPSTDTNNVRGNVNLTSENGSITMNNIVADTDIIASAGETILAKGLTADADNNGVGDLLLTAKNLDVDGAAGKNITTESSVDSIIKNVTGTDNVTITTGGNAVVENVIADGNKDGIGDLTINGKGNVDVTVGSGNNVTINGNGDNSDVTVKDITANNDVDIKAGHDVNADDVKGNNDVVINAGNEVNGKDLIADADNNGVGDLLLTAKNLDVDGAAGKNITTESSVDSIIKNVTGTDNVTITTGGNAVVENVIADGNKDGIGDLTINGKGDVEVTGSEGKNVVISSDKNATVTDVEGADDVTITTGGNVIADKVIADANGDGIGDLTINGQGTVNVDNSQGKNVDITSGVDAIVNNVTGADDVTITTGGNAVVENVIADGNKDGIGDLTINGKGDVEVTGSEGKNVVISSDKNATVTDVEGADDVTITTGGNVIADKVIADANGDGIGDLTINGQGTVNVDNSQGKNVDITSGVDAIVNNVTGADDVTITTGGNAVVENVIADGNKDGIGDLTINGKGDVEVTGGSGNNVTINGNGDNSDVTVKDITANNDVDIKAGHDVNADDVKGNNDVVINAGNEVIGTDLIADADKDGEGDLIINGNKVTVDGGEGNNVDITGKGDVDVKNIDAHENKNAEDGNKGGNVNITSEGGNITINPVDEGDKGVHGDNDVIINAKDGDVNGKDLTADADKDGEGDLNISGNNVNVDGGEGNNVNVDAKDDADVKNITANEDPNRDKGDGNGNVNINAGNDVNGENVKADNDVNIGAGNDVTGKDLVADADNDGEGDLNINAGGNVNVDGGEGKNVDIDAGGDVDVKNITAGDDVNIDAGGEVKGDDLTADDDKDGQGSININAGGNVELGNTNGKVIVNGIDISDNGIVSEVMKNLNNLSQSGVSTAMAQSFTPIAFAADDDDDEQSVLAKKIAKTVFRTEDGTVSITDRFNTIK